MTLPPHTNTAYTWDVGTEITHLHRLDESVYDKVDHIGRAIPELHGPQSARQPHPILAQFRPEPGYNSRAGLLDYGIHDIFRGSQQVSLDIMR